MERLAYTPDIKELLRTKVWGVLNDVFIKRKKGTSYIETLDIIYNNLDKLTLEYYAILDRFYYDDNGYIKAYGGKYYGEYRDFREYYLDNTIDKSQVLRDVIKAVLELEAIGIHYTDIHARNIIVNSEGKAKLVDLDEAHPYLFKESKASLLLDIIIECFILYDINKTAWEYVTPRYALKELDSKKVLSSSFQTALNGTQSDTCFYSNVDSYIDELLDEEKVSIIRKDLIQTKPHYF